MTPSRPHNPWPVLLASLLLATATFAAEKRPGSATEGKPDNPYAADPSPALSPEESEKKFVVPNGFEVRLFAAEPMIKNPVAMSWDERGRLWVVELIEYPDGAKKGVKGRDVVKILEDTNGDGKADKMTIFADGLSLATGLVLGNGGVYVGQAPDLYFYPILEENGETKAGERKTVLTGFGMQDRHELLNSFCWGPDGWMYFTEGVFTHSKVKDPANPADPGLDMDAVVARYNPIKKKIEIFSDGVSNQWGVDFDRYGNAFVSACVVDHLWHVQPGGVYVRQGGQPNVKYTYELLKSINDHKHFRAAYGGINIYQGDMFPDQYRGTVFMGNIHGNCLDHDILKPNGSSFIASDARTPGDNGEFLEAHNGWFRPVSEQVGPDGALWVMDWCDKYPCYQNSHAPDLDRERGRIWRVVYTGNDKSKKIPSHPDKMDLSKMTDDQLVGQLAHPNIWQRRTAQRLTERNTKASAPMNDLLKNGKTLETRMAALWTLGSANLLDDAALDALLTDKEPAVRTWAARFTAERGDTGKPAIDRLLKLAKDPGPTVRAGVAVAARKLSEGDTIPILGTLLQQKGTDTDPNLPFLIWRAAEAKVASDPKPLFDWILQHSIATSAASEAPPHIGPILAAPAAPSAPSTDPNAAQANLLQRTIRRIWDTNDTDRMNQAAAFIDSIADKNPALAAAAVEGLLDWKRNAGRAALPRPNAFTDDLLNKLTSNKEPAVADRARQLAAAWGSDKAAAQIIAKIKDPTTSETDRLTAIRFARTLKGDAIRATLIALLDTDASNAIKLETVRALTDQGDDALGEDIVKAWPKLSPETRRAASEVLTTKAPWGRSLLTGVERKTVDRADITLTAVRNLANQNDKRIKELLPKTIGAYNPSNDEKIQLIAARRPTVFNGPVDLAAGKEVMQKNCLACHTFYGEGGKVGPDLTGSGRASIDALLSNILDPNLIVGAGYENTIVELKDSSLVTGRLIEDTPDQLKLINAQGEVTVATKDIKEKRTTPQSVMPEGFEALSESDFRNLIWYVFNPPQDDKQKKIRLDIAGKKLIIKARLPGQESMTDLLTYVIDPDLRPYLHPVKDPSAQIVLTQNTPPDHPWQHGIFTGLHEVNKLDFWEDKKEYRQHFKQLLDVEEAPDHVSARTLTNWTGPDGQTVCDEEQKITVYQIDSLEFYRIDFDWTLRAKDKAVEIGKFDFGGLSIRMKDMPNHTHLNSNNDKGQPATANKSASWCNVSNTYDDKTFGIAVLAHPQNFDFPPLWRVDGQGMISPSPSMKGNWSIAPNKEKRLHYRLVIHTGPGNPKLLDSQEKEFEGIKF